MLTVTTVIFISVFILAACSGNGAKSQAGSSKNENSQYGKKINRAESPIKDEEIMAQYINSWGSFYGWNYANETEYTIRKLIRVDKNDEGEYINIEFKEPVKPGEESDTITKERVIEDNNIKEYEDYRAKMDEGYDSELFNELNNYFAGFEKYSFTVQFYDEDEELVELTYFYDTYEYYLR